MAEWREEGRIRVGTADPSAVPVGNSFLAAGTSTIAGTMSIDTQSPRERYADVTEAGCALADGGSLDGCRLVHAQHPDGGLEIFVMDASGPVAAALLQPWDAPEGHMVRHASVEETHRGRGLVRSLYLHLIRDGMTLLSDNERSPEAERLWRWLASSGEVRLSLLPAMPDEGEEGEVPLPEASALPEREDPAEWHYVAHLVEPKAAMSPPIR
jgi:hypothetical protein